MEGDEAQFEAAYALKRLALGPHVIPRWGWDEAAQRAIMLEKWRAKRFFRITQDEKTVGTIAIDEDERGIHISEFYIAPQFQRRGIGSAVLEPILREAEQGGKTAHLECLRWNPAVALYLRHGLRIVRETETHYVMERTPPPGC
jgi:ribosomal protein S18 acetylase RimI-like enzyme